MPIDEKSDPKGNLDLVTNDLVVVVPKDKDTPSGLRYISHFATCPNAKKHRKDKPC